MIHYGFGNYHQSEAEKGALPLDQNSPQRCPQGLIAEQISGTAFTRPREFNLKTWFYRRHPSTGHEPFLPYSKTLTQPLPAQQSPNQERWSPQADVSQPTDFIDGLFHIAGNETVQAYLYHCNLSMQRYFKNHDGELLLVPYRGSMTLATECGRLTIKPGMIAVIPRGIVFKVELHEDYAAGYIAENSGHPLILPQLGPIGANSLAHPRHFAYPRAAYEEDQGECLMIAKYDQGWWQSKHFHSPLNVVAWHGNYAPYSYDLSLFNTINTVSFDHPDPSIFTVLTSPSDTPGVANMDFVIFPPRWMVAEHTFRPPYFHRNVMSELMGLIQGQYDAKKEGFAPGGISIHNCMSAHGPDQSTFKAASEAELKPERYRDTLAFMFETRQPWRITTAAMQHPSRQKDYWRCWL